MKNFILTISIIIFTQFVYGQFNNTVSTNPQNPFNNSLPDSVGSSGIPYATDSRYLNAFDWINGVNLPANKGYYLHNMQFNSTQYYDTMNNIQDVNMDEYWNVYNQWC